MFTDVFTFDIIIFFFLMCTSIFYFYNFNIVLVIHELIIIAYHNNVSNYCLILKYSLF